MHCGHGVGTSKISIGALQKFVLASDFIVVPTVVCSPQCSPRVPHLCFPRSPPFAFFPYSLIPRSVLVHIVILNEFQIVKYSYNDVKWTEGHTPFRFVTQKSTLHLPLSTMHSLRVTRSSKATKAPAARFSSPHPNNRSREHKNMAHPSPAHLELSLDFLHLIRPSPCVHLPSSRHGPSHLASPLVNST